MEVGQSRREFLKLSAAAGLGTALGASDIFGFRSTPADLILTNGRFHTLQKMKPLASALAVRDGRFLTVGDTHEVMAHRGPLTRVIDLSGATVIPGLNDSHMHPIRGGLNYNLELRWD